MILTLGIPLFAIVLGGLIIELGAYKISTFKQHLLGFSGSFLLSITLIELLPNLFEQHKEPRLISLIILETLEYERGVTAGQASGYWGVTIQVDDMIEELSKLEHDGEPLLSDPVVRDDLVGFIMEAKALSLTGRRSGIPALTSDYPMGLALSVKYIRKH